MATSFEKCTCSPEPTCCLASGATAAMEASASWCGAEKGQEIGVELLLTLFLQEFELMRGDVELLVDAAAEHHLMLLLRKYQLLLLLRHRSHMMLDFGLEQRLSRLWQDWLTLALSGSCG